MKLSRHAFQTFWDVHAWAGVLTSLVLHVIFFAGMFALFRHELAAWQDPATLSSPHGPRVPTAVIERMVAEHDLTGAGVSVGLATPHHPMVTMAWTDRAASARRVVRIDPDTGDAVAERSRLSEFLFHVHFLWHDDVPQLFLVTGFLGVALLLVLVTGLLIHLKGLGRQLFRFRPDRGARLGWIDLHKVLGTWGLPAQAMFAFTGAFICLSELVLPRFVGPVFHGDRDATERALYGDFGVAPARGEPGDLLPLDDLVGRAEAAAGMHAEQVRIYHWGDADSTAVVSGRVSEGLYPHAMVKIRARDGAVTYLETPETLPAAQALSHAVYGLHFAHHGGLGLDFLYLLLGLGGCATILSGNVIWLARREARRAHPGNRALARLTAAVGGGMAMAVAALLAANRLLPLDWTGRADAEIQIFFGVWLAAGIVCTAVRNLRTLWTILLGLAGATFALVPVLGLITRPLGLFDLGTLPGHPVAVVDLMVLGLGTALIMAARHVRRTARSQETKHG
jgi:uncharacterized iron-regulated membrane protein